MSVWGKVSGAAAGLFVGGPVGAVVGAVVGHIFVDREADPGVTFTIAVVALAGKMARADGVVTDQEFQVFRQVFGVPPEEQANVQRIFNLARQDIAGYEHYAGQIARLFMGNPAMLEDILDGLFHIAKADGALHDQELIFLGTVAEIFALDEDKFDRILARHVNRGQADPFLVLGISRDASFEEARKQYRALVRENHPDMLIARGVPEEFIAIANQRIAAINAAWEKVEKDLKAYESV